MTLIDLVVVVVILALVAAVAAPRFFDDRSFLERGYYEELAAALKYAQKLAVASGCPVRMQIDARGYEARQQGAQAGACDRGDSSWSAVVDHGRELLSGTSPVGVEPSPGLTVVFDALGHTDLGADQRISVGPFALTLRAESGFVEAP